MRYFDILMQLISTCLQTYFTNKGAFLCFCSVLCYPRIRVNINNWIKCNYSIAWMPLRHCALMFDVCKYSRTQRSWNLASLDVYFIWPTRCNLYNVLYYYQRSTCFGRPFRPLSGAYKTVCAALGIVMLSCCLPLVWMGWNSPPTHSFKGSWWWAEGPPETCRALIIIKNII
jgi:hypothetical protein